MGDLISFMPRGDDPASDPSWFDRAKCEAAWAAIASGGFHSMPSFDLEAAFGTGWVNGSHLAAAQLAAVSALLNEAVGGWYDEYRGCSYGWCKFCGCSAWGRGLAAKPDVGHEPDCLVNRAAALNVEVRAGDASEGKEG